MTVEILDVRNKNSNLLMTDSISDSKIQECIDDSKETVKTRLQEVFDSDTLTDEKLTTAVDLCIKLIAASNAIKDSYSQDKEALDTARDYYNEANTNLKSIISGTKLKKTGVTNTKTYSQYKSSSDLKADDYITKLNNSYR